MSTPSNLLVIEDRVIREMARDPRFAHLSCVQSFNSRVAASKTKCGRCKKKIEQAAASAMVEFSRCLTRLPPATRAQVKQLLNTRQLRAFTTNSKGQRVQMTF